MQHASPVPRLVPWSAPDGTRLFARIWNTAGEPAGRVVYLHGILSHGGWFSASCRKLVEEGQEVHFLDRRGSGLNWQERGDVPGVNAWLNDVDAYLAKLPRDCPRTLVGVSWGGKLAAAVAARSPGCIDRLALLYPGLYSQIEPAGWKRWLLAAAARAGLGHCRVQIPLSEPSQFTFDVARQAFIARDPLALRTVTVRFLQAHLALDEHIAQAAERIRVPTLVMLAGRDRIVDNARVTRFYDKITTSDKRLIEYPSAAHTLEFEPHPQPFLKDLAEWIGRKG